MVKVVQSIRMEPLLWKAAKLEAKRDGFEGNVSAFLRNLLTEHLKVHP